MQNAANTPRFLRPLMLAYALLLVGLGLRYCLPMPYADHFSIYMILRDYYANGFESVIKYGAGSPEHWMTLVYAILISLALVTNWNLHAETALMLVLLFASAWIVLRLFKRDFNEPKRWLLELIAIAFLFSPIHLGNLIWGIDILSFLSLLSLCAALYMLTLPSLRWKQLVLAMLFCLPGIYSYSPSYALLPMGLWLVITHPNVSRRGLLTAAWCAFCAFLLWQRIQVSMNPIQPASPLDYVWFMLNCASAPISRFTTGAAIPLALLGLGSAAFATWNLGGKNWKRGIIITRAFWSLVIYGLAVGALIGYGRLGEFGMGQAFVARYMTVAMPFWLGISLIIGLALMRTSSRCQQRGFTFCLIVIACFLAGNSIQQTNKQARLYHKIADAKARIIDGTWTKEDELMLYAAYTPSVPFAEIIADMKQRHIGGF